MLLDLLPLLQGGGFDPARYGKTGWPGWSIRRCPQCDRVLESPVCRCDTDMARRRVEDELLLCGLI